MTQFYGFKNSKYAIVIKKILNKNLSSLYIYTLPGTYNNNALVLLVGIYAFCCIRQCFYTTFCCCLQMNYNNLYLEYHWNYYTNNTTLRLCPINNKNYCTTTLYNTYRVSYNNF